MARSQQKGAYFFVIIAIVLLVAFGFGAEQTVFMGQDFAHEQNTSLGAFSAVAISTKPLGESTVRTNLGSDYYADITTKNTFSPNALNVEATKAVGRTKGTFSETDNGPARPEIKTAVLTQNAGITAANLNSVSITFSHSNSITCSGTVTASGGKSGIYLYSEDQVIQLWNSPAIFQSASTTPSSQSAGTIEVKRSGQKFVVVYQGAESGIALKPNTNYEIAIFSEVSPNECGSKSGTTAESISVSNIAVSRVSGAATNYTVTTETPKLSLFERASPVFTEKTQSTGSSDSETDYLALILVVGILALAGTIGYTYFTKRKRR